MGSVKARRVFLLCSLFIAVCAAALFLGRYPAPGFTPPAALRYDPTARAVVFGSRLPRVLGAVLVGASLGGAGAAFQLVFANPLVEPGFLGVSQGAAFGAALAMVLGAGFGPAVAGAAFAFAILALAASSWLARKFKFGGSVLRLVLAGISVSAVFSAGLAVIKYAADPLSQLPDIAYWTLGGLSGMDWPTVRLLAPPVSVSLVLLMLLRRRIDLLSLDDDVSRSLGAHPEAERAFVLATAALGVAASVAASGVVSWAGLVVPHAARAVVGADARASVPASMLLGAVFLVVCDAAARTAFAGELPLGATVSALGAAVFVSFLAAGRSRIVR
jgi:iron complex transport system permease protein